MEYSVDSSPEVKLPKPSLNLEGFRWLTEITPNGGERQILQYKTTDDDEWKDVTKCSEKRRLEWA